MSTSINQRQKQKSLLIDPSNLLQFNVGNQNIRMKKVKAQLSANNSLRGGFQLPSPTSNRSNSISINQKIYYSIVQKQSQTGMSFNNRLFFVKDQDVFGYMSKLDPGFQVKAAKQSVPLKNLRKIIPKGKMLTLEFQVRTLDKKHNQKVEEKKWVLRMKDKKMVDAWTDIINYQVAQIPSRKSTMDNHHGTSQQALRSRQASLKKDEKSQMQLKAQTSQKYISNKVAYTDKNFSLKQRSLNSQEPPIANQRPEQNYFSVFKQSPQKRQQQSPAWNLKQIQYQQFQSSPQKGNNFSPNSRSVNDDSSPQKNKSSKQQQMNFSPQNFAAKTYQKQMQSVYNSTSQKHFTKKQRYMTSNIKFQYNSQFIAEKTYHQQVLQNFKIKNQQIKNKLIFPSFMNYFRPYLQQISLEQIIESEENTQLVKKLSSDSRRLLSEEHRLAPEVDRKFDQFISYCEITAKQLIDDTEELNDFKLCNRFYAAQDVLTKDRLLKEMKDMHEKVFGKVPTNDMEIEALFLLFQNVLYIELEDIQIIIPLMELKILPSINNPDKPSNSNDANSSTNKICQNSLLREFQTKQRNFSFIYDQLTKEKILQQFFFIPITCQVSYKGFKIFFKTKTDQNMYNITSTNFYDSRKQMSQLRRISFNGNKEEQQITLEFLHNKLASVLFIKPQTVENQSFLKIKTIKLKQNQLPSSSILNITNYKYIVQFADILPYINDTYESITGVVFESVHNCLTINQSVKQISSIVKKTSNKPYDQSNVISPGSRNIKNTSQKKKPTNMKNKLDYYNHQAPSKQNQYQTRAYKQLIDAKIKQIAAKLDQHDTVIIHYFEMNQLLNSNGLSYFTLGKIYKEISGKNSFVKSLIKTEIATQCVQMIIFKKVQQVYLNSKQIEQGYHKIRNQIAEKNIIAFLNIILGRAQTKQSELIWKVLNLHAQVLFGSSLAREQMHKGYFILGLVSKLNIILNPNTIVIDDIFKTDKFVASIKFQTSQSNAPFLHDQMLKLIYSRDLVYLQKLGSIFYRYLIEYFQLNTSPIPYFIKKSKTLYNKVLFILTKFISPTDLTFNHLNIYENRSLNFSQTQIKIPVAQNIQNKFTFVQSLNKIKQRDYSLKRQMSKDNFYMFYKRKIEEFKHKVNQSLDVGLNLNNFSYVQKNIQNMIKEIKIFFQYHPIISELLEFLVLFYIIEEIAQNHKALQFSKRSLSNYISLCEGNSNHIKLAKCFANVSLVYQKMKRYDQSLNQLKRSKHCLEVNKDNNSAFYAKILVKLAQLNLTIQNPKLQQALINAMSAQRIIQSDQNILTQNLTLLIQSYQIQATCLSSPQLNLNIISKKYEINPQTRVEHYITILESILRKQIYLNKNKLQSIKAKQWFKLEHFQRMLKIILPHYFRTIEEKGGEMLMAYFCQVSQSIAKKGGVSYVVQTQAQKHQLNSSQKIFQAGKSMYYPSKKSYNIHESSNYIKKLIIQGTFILDLFSYIQNTQQILSQIRQQIQLSKYNKQFQSRSSSRMYLMSTKGAQSNEQRMSNDEVFELQKLLDSQKYSPENTQKITKQRRFDSMMKALIVLLGEGFMLHIFEQ